METRTHRRRKARRAARAVLRPAVVHSPAAGPDRQPPAERIPDPPRASIPLDTGAMTRRQIMDELDELGVEHSPRATRAALISLLWTAGGTSGNRG